jgi:hypothetical protein
MKNFIISTLLIVILNMMDGWSIPMGVGRILYSLVLIVLLDIVIVELERIWKYGRRYNP